MTVRRGADEQKKWFGATTDQRCYSARGEGTNAGAGASWLIPICVSIRENRPDRLE